MDGKPLLGSHKTVKGTISAIVVGTLIGVIQGNLLGGLLQSIGAMMGDIVFSFVKRRFNLRPGASLPLADQLGFIIFAVILQSLVPPQPTWRQSIVIIVITFPIHYLVNIIAWALKLKKDPW